MRELLKEARDFIDEVDPNIKGQEIEKHYLLQRIDAALAEPELDVMELVEKIREKKDYNTDAGLPPRMGYTLITPEAVALIAAHGKRLPRAMLAELCEYGLNCGFIPETSRKIDLDEIAAKYGVKIEE